MITKEEVKQILIALVVLFLLGYSVWHELLADGRVLK